MFKRLVSIITLLLVTNVFLVGCGGGGSSSNPVSSLKGPSTGLGSLRGVITDNSNQPVSNAHVWIIQSDKATSNALLDNKSVVSKRFAVADEGYRETTTNTKGEFAFDNLPYGVYTLTSKTYSMVQSLVRLAVDENTNEEIKVVLKPFGKLTGKVTNASGNVVSNAFVYLSGASYCSITDANGLYTINTLPVDTNFTLCVKSAEGIGDDQSVTVPSETLVATKDISLKTDSSSAPNGQDYVIHLYNTGDDGNIPLSPEEYKDFSIFAIDNNGCLTVATRVENSQNPSYAIRFTKLGWYALYLVDNKEGVTGFANSMEINIRAFESSKVLVFNINKQVKTNAAIDLTLDAGSVVDSCKVTFIRSDDSKFTTYVGNASKSGGEKLNIPLGNYIVVLDNGKDYFYSEGGIHILDDNNSFLQGIAKIDHPARIQLFDREGAQDFAVTTDFSGVSMFCKYVLGKNLKSGNQENLLAQDVEFKADEARGPYQVTLVSGDRLNEEEKIYSVKVVTEVIFENTVVYTKVFDYDKLVYINEN